MKVCCFAADSTGCFFYRVKQPFNALNKVGVSLNPIIYIPSTMFGEKLPQLYELIGQYDLVIVQRCFEYRVVRLIRQACDLLGKRMVFETDDDCFNVAPDNPSYNAVMNPEVQGNYPEILRMADAVTVTTNELRNVIYPYNRNVYVFPNHVESIYCGEYGTPKRDMLEETLDESGLARIANVHGVVGIPAFRTNKRFGHPDTKERIIRIGYTATPSHVGDFMTISKSIDRVCEKLGAKIWLVIIGEDDSQTWSKMLNTGRKRVAYINLTTNIQQYFWHIRNIDIGLAPLQRNLFNMSKSSLKALEYGMWGIPAILPNYVTYARDFTSGKNCLMYNSPHEFEDALITLVEDHQLRDKLGIGARDYVKATHMEGDPKNYEPRYELCKCLVNDSRKITTRSRKDEIE